MRFKVLTLVGLLAVATACGAPQTSEPDQPRPSVDPEIGALGTLTSSDTLRGVGSVSDGKVYSLGVITGADTPAFGERGFSMEIIPHGEQPAYGVNGAIAMDDIVTTNLGVGSQIDGFAHMGSAGTYFGDTPESEVFSVDGVKRFGTHNIPPIATKGVLLDITALKSVDRLAADYVVTTDDLEAALERQGSSIGAGDVALIHTGWQSLASDDPAAFLQGQPGINTPAAMWLAERGVVAVGADNWGLEIFPNPDPQQVFPVHTFLLGDNGIHILESMDTSALAADEAYEFLFVLGVPRLEGAVQMVINPVAIR